MKISHDLRIKILTSASNPDITIEKIEFVSQGGGCLIPLQQELGEIILLLDPEEEYDLIYEIREWMNLICGYIDESINIRNSDDFKIDLGPFTGLMPHSLNVVEHPDKSVEVEFMCDLFEPDKLSWRDWF